MGYFAIIIAFKVIIGYLRNIMCYLIIIMTIVLYFLIRIWWQFKISLTIPLHEKDQDAMVECGISHHQMLGIIWTVIPAFGIKVNAIPGRLNAVYLIVECIGIFYGQCSKICGEYYNAMPINISVQLLSQFRKWVYFSLEVVTYDPNPDFHVTHAYILAIKKI